MSNKTTSTIIKLTPTITNDLLREYNQCVAAEKAAKERKDELRDAILAGHEEFKSSLFLVSVTTSTSTRLESLKEIKNKSTKLYDALMTAGCIYESEAKRITVEEIK